MKKIILAAACLALIGCKKHAKDATVTAKDGAQGIQGVKGDKGEKGNNGLDGKNGINGVDGKDGKKGEAGANGRDGKDGKTGPQGPRGATGPAGKDGKDGLNGPNLTIYRTPTKGKCVYLGEGIWFENEGDHGDFYNNNDCDHSGGSKKAFCNDVADAEDIPRQNEVCWVNNRQFTIQGQNKDLCVYELTFPKPLDIQLLQ